MVEKVYHVSDMFCAACSARVKKTGSKLDGVSYCEVNLLTEKMTIAYDEEKQSFDSIKAAVVKAGYGLEEITEQNEEPKEEKQKKTGLWVLVSAICALPVLYLNLNHMIPSAKLPVPDFISANPGVNAAIQLILTAVVLIIGRDFFIRGTRAALNKSPNMDTLVAIGSAAAMGESIYSAVKIFAGLQSETGHLYCESAAMVVTLVSLGRWLEERAKVKTGDALRALNKLRPDTAHVLRGDAVFEKDAAALERDDIIVIRPGEAIPADCEVLEGSTSADEAMLTGESMPVEKGIGDVLIGGSMNIDGAVTAKVTADAQGSMLSKIIKLVEDAQNRQAPVARLADKVAGVFVPAVMGIALLSAVLWAISGKNAEFCINIAIGVLVVACPCALGLATPCSIMTGTGRSAALGVLFKSGASLEGLSGVRAVVFDKTGTLTCGMPKVSDVVNIDSDHPEYAGLCAAAEKSSEHPVGRAIASLAQDECEVADMRAIPGQGVEAVVNGRHVLAGSSRLMSENKIDIADAKKRAEALEKQGKTVVYAALDGRISTLFALEDELRPDSLKTVEKLRATGRRVYMLTGDNETSAMNIAKRCGIDEENVFAGVLPDKKREVVAALNEKMPVAMVGDGINDAPALTEAAVGIAMTGGNNRATDIAVDAADVVLLRGEISQVWDALSLSSGTMLNIKENLFWAFAYNAVCIPAAAGLWYAFGGSLLTPVWGGAAMAASSICVVSNALRLRRYKVK